MAVKSTFRLRLAKRMLVPVILTVAAAGVATPVIANTLAGVNAPGTRPAAPVLAQPTVSNPVVPWMRALSETIHAAPSDGALPGGCATLVGHRICVPRVTVDGTTLSQTAILTQMLGIATRPTSSTSLPDSAQIIAALSAATIQQQAIASTVADQILYQSAGTAIASTSTAAARALAQEELQAYLADPAAGQAAGILPPGVSPQQYFASQAMLGAYQRLAIIRGQTSAITGSHMTVGTWVRQHLAGHVVLVDGAGPAFSLASALTLT
jgi:hypothetical protein